jgi:hypothetical protein
LPAESWASYRNALAARTSPSSPASRVIATNSFKA